MKLLDTHCDTLFEFWSTKEFQHIPLTGKPVFAPHGQFFALWTDPNFDFDKALREQLSIFHHFVERGNLVHCRTADDFEICPPDKIAAFLAAEGAEMIDCDVRRLPELFEAGVRMLSLTWNNSNSLAGCVADRSGLTSKGAEFVERVFDLGMILDVSHLSERAFWNVVPIAKRCGKPIVASHSNSQRICGNYRNLTDEQFRAVAELGGYVGLNLFTRFLEGSDRSSFEDVFAHVRHFLNLGGEDHLGFGCDFDGCDTLPDGIETIADLPKLIDALPVSDAIKEKISYQNSLGVVKQVCVM